MFWSTLFEVVDGVAFEQAMKKEPELPEQRQKLLTLHRNIELAGLLLFLNLEFHLTTDLLRHIGKKSLVLYEVQLHRIAKDQQEWLPPWQSLQEVLPQKMHQWK